MNRIANSLKARSYECGVVCCSIILKRLGCCHVMHVLTKALRLRSYSNGRESFLEYPHLSKRSEVTARAL
jgi:hypothetical protein